MSPDVVKLLPLGVVFVPDIYEAVRVVQDLRTDVKHVDVEVLYG